VTTTLALSFPWGLYHATPWGRDVNEAAVEWPPSPWRLLRGLYATWRWRLPELEAPVVKRLLSELAVPPAYLLPAYREAHTRHYMPDVAYGTDKVFDAFVAMERDAQALVRWPCDLDTESRQVLSALARGLSYVGRAESICEAHLAEPPEEKCPERAEAGWLEPLGHEAPSVSDRWTPRIRVLAPRRPLDLASLTVRTTAVRAAGFTIPPGTEWVVYRKPETATVRPPARHVIHSPPTVARWAFASNAQPSIKASVAVDDVLRQACMGRFGRRFDGAVSEVLSGKNAVGAPLAGHRHAHYLALDVDRDRLVDHLAIWAPSGLDRPEVSALADLDRLVGYGHVSDFRPGRLGLEAMGTPAEVVPELVGPAARWRSLTPFAPPRHAHKHQLWDEYLRQQVTEELGRRSFPAPKSVRLLAGDWLSYRRYRIRERLEDGRTAVGVELAFEEEVAGPLALGALSHFGLGLFVPAE
jgi:CRISPR-associated protein Csb2